jgi:hypothetical protein
MSTECNAGINGWSGEASKYNFAAPGYTPAAGHFTCVHSTGFSCMADTALAAWRLERGLRVPPHDAALRQGCDAQAQCCIEGTC